MLLNTENLVVDSCVCCGVLVDEVIPGPISMMSPEFAKKSKVNAVPYTLFYVRAWPRYLALQKRVILLEQRLELHERQFNEGNLRVQPGVTPPCTFSSFHSSFLSSDFKMVNNT